LLAVRVVPLPQDAQRVLDGLVAPPTAPSAGLWSRLKSAALDRKFHADRAAKARAVLGRRACEDVEIWHDSPPAMAQHEHGLFFFVHAGAGATLLLDVSSVSEDVRWTLYQENRLLRQRWHWYRFVGLDGPWCFTADGPPMMPVYLGDFHGTALERRLTEEMDWPGDDALVPLPLEQIVQLSRQRAAAA
jgi:hypothetical protein